MITTNRLVERLLAQKVSECGALRKFCERAAAGRYDDFVDALAPVLGPAQHAAVKAMLGGPDALREHMRSIGAVTRGLRLTFRESAMVDDAGSGEEDDDDAPSADGEQDRFASLCAKLGIDPGGVTAGAIGESFTSSSTSQEVCEALGVRADSLLGEVIGAAYQELEEDADMILPNADHGPVESRRESARIDIDFGGKKAATNALRERSAVARSILASHGKPTTIGMTFSS